MIFDITKTVVVNDFETLVNGEVDYIDSKTYEIERRRMDVPINHSDGCGIILPRVNNKNFMIRLPWVKGLVSPFAFDEFCSRHGASGDIVDIYGKEYNIFKDEIEIIFTKSQFKMWKYYDSWQDYIDKYIKHDCQSGRCNEDKDFIRNARLNYQMLQTLPDMTDEELKTITEKTRTDILNIAADRKTMLKVFGAAEYNQNKTYLQRALEIYPEMLADNYCKEILKMIKKKLVKTARAAKFEVDGKYTFIVPDLYAFCENLFLGHENPSGLLKDNEVHCRLFPESKELDCLRSPHLYREHAVRRNVIDDKKKKWFVSRGLYTSCHDLISKMLQFDVDGDTSLVCADKTIIEAAKRNMSGIVPLYYEMGSAKPVIVDKEKLYEGLVFAFANCNIGAVSNDITKIWNGGNIDLDVIKLLCMENNFVIDAAKTLTKLERPEDKKDYISQHTKKKLPYFFIYAKDKEKHQVEKINNSVVNRLSQEMPEHLWYGDKKEIREYIPNKRMTFNKKIFGDFEYKMLTTEPDIEIDEKVIEVYLKLQMDNKFNINIEDVEHSNIAYIYQENRTKLLDVCDDSYKLSDMLVKYLYEVKNSKQKEALWFAFGDIMLENLQRNLDKKYGGDYILCEGCAERITKTNNRQKYCRQCWEKREQELKRNWKQKRDKTKKVEV